MIALALVPAVLWADENPVTDFFNQLFGTGEKAADRPLDFVDRHAPLAPTDLLRSLKQTEKLASEGKWPAVVETLQFLIDRSEDSVLKVRGEWKSLKREAESRLRAMPEAGRRAYLNTFEKVASDLLVEARAKQDFEAVCAVASRFWSTPAGQSAADEIATVLADSGDFGGAAIWLAQLEEERSPITLTAAWRLRAASIWKQLERMDRAETLLATLDAPAQEKDQLKLALKAVSPSRNSPIAERDWTGILGGKTRSASASGDRPLLIEEWSAPASARDEVQHLVEELRSELGDTNQLAIPAAQPVAVNNRIAVRTLRGVEVRDIESGRLLWANDDRFSAEQFLTGPSGKALSYGIYGGYARWDEPEQHPLASLLYRDGVLGQITADSKRVFMIEQRLPLLSEEYDIFTTFENDPEGMAALRWDHSVNAIAAYDLESGQKLWSIGGPRSDEPFAPTLAGVYFFGPPTPDGGELFAVGAQGNDVRLFCIDAATGLPQWSQLVAQYDGLAIANDIARQMWACPPTVTRGLVICPTNAGWLTAIDRLRRRISWVHRYSTEHLSDRYEPRYSILELGERFAPSAPIIAGGTVVFTPTELPDETMQTDAQLFELDLVTGKPLLLSRQKGDQLISLGGVFGSTVVLLGQQQISAHSLDRRSNTLWRTAYPDGRTPCGQGIAAEGVYWVPFSEGAVTGFSLSDGKIVADLKNPEARNRLGNLVLHGDRLLSVSPTGIVCYWQQGPLESRVAARLKERSDDLEARIISARRAAAQGDWQAALDQLAAANVDEAKNSTTYAEVRWKCLLELVKASPTERDAEWTELETLATDPGRLQELARTAIDRAISRKDWKKAAEECSKLIEKSGNQEVTDGDFAIKLREWGFGRLKEVWEQAPAEVRALVDREVEVAITKARESGNSRSLSIERAFAFHPQGQRLALERGQAQVTNEKWSLRELRLRELARSDDAAVRREALCGLVDLWIRANSVADARRSALTLKSDVDGRLTTGESAHQWAETWLAAHPEESDSGQRPGWNLDRCEMIRSAVDFGAVSRVEFEIPGRPARWFAGRSLSIESAWEGLACHRERDGVREWSLPLAETSSYGGEPMPVAVAEGSVMVLAYRGLVHAYSPVDGSELWNFALPARFARPSEYTWGLEQMHSEAATPADELVTQFKAASAYRRTGVLLAIAGRYCAILGQRELIVLDLLNGEPIWRRTGISPSAILVADGDAVCVSELTDSEGPGVFRFADGKPLPNDQFKRNLDRCMAISGDRLITADTTFGLIQRQTRIAAVSPRSGKADWEQSFPQGTRFGRGRTLERIAIAPDGTVTTLDTENGARNNVGKLPADPRKGMPEILTISDSNNVYLMVNHASIDDYSYLSLSSLRANGDLYAFDRTKPDRKWKRSVKGLNLVVSQFGMSPVVLLAGFRTEERGTGANSLYTQNLDLLALDKSSGREIVRWSGAITGGSPSVMSVDVPNKRIDILSYNERVRLQFPAHSRDDASASR